MGDANNLVETLLGSETQKRDFEVNFSLWGADYSNETPLGTVYIEHTGTTEERVTFATELKAVIKSFSESKGAKCIIWNETRPKKLEILKSAGDDEWGANNRTKS